MKALLASVVLFTGLLALPTVQPSQAMWTDARYAAGQFSYSDANITHFTGTVGRESLYNAEWAWEVTDLWKWVNPYACNSCGGASARTPTFGWVDGVMGGILATATVGCTGAIGCAMTFDDRDRWNTTSEWRDSNWIDFRTVAAHEFGHWLGLRHSYDRPTTDPAGATAALMCDGCHGYGAIYRQIRQDDVNGVKAARAYLDILTANDSFEFGWYGWGFRRVWTGSGTIYCPGSIGQNCFLQYNGASNSVYQDVTPRGGGYTMNGGRNMWGQGRFRNRSGLAGQQVQVVVWNLENNTIVAQQVCGLPIGSEWIHCTTAPFTTDGRNMRIEYYNNTGNNVDLDIAILG